MNTRLVIVHPFTQSTVVSPWGFELATDFEYQEGEPPIRDIEHAHPGYPPNAILVRCSVGGIDITEMLSLSQRERIEEAILAQIEG